MNRLLTMTAVLTLAAASAYAQGRGFGPAMTPSKLRSIPAETTAAKAKDPNWKAPRTAWGQPDLSGHLDERRHARHPDDAAGRRRRIASR